MSITRTDLIILAFLSEQPAHGWDIDRRLIEMGADLWAEYSRPNLYYALRKLEKSGLIEKDKADKSSSRKSYRVTNKGQSSLREGVNLHQFSAGRTYFDFDLLLGFSRQLHSNESEFLELLKARQEEMEIELDRAQEVWQKAEMESGVPFGRMAVMRHRIKFLKSEIEFLKWLAKSAPDGWESLNK